jgi:hypothetical protein
MASLSNINGLFDVHSTGAILFSTSHGTSGQILQSSGNAAPIWVNASTIIGGPYLPLSGGTLTGATSTSTGISFTVGGNLIVNGASATVNALSATTGSFSGNVTAPTFNSLAINTTGTNNVANQIVRTEGNGYVNFGWIQSTSGNHTGSITRITASNDQYLRYVTPAQFRVGVTDGYYAPTGTVSGVTSVATGNGLTGGTITSTGTLSMSGSYSGTLTATTFSGPLTGNATTSTTFNTGRTNYYNVTNNAVIGQMMWKNYGNNHTIFDASQSTSPSGSSVNNTNSNTAWTAAYPTLMGWNGSSTYGVRVDSARVADSTTGSAASAASAGTLTHNANRVDSTSYPVVWMSGSPSPAYSCAAVTITSSVGRINATTFNGALTGNATTASTLATNGAVSFTTDNSGFHVIGTESTGSNVRVGSAWSRPGIYNGSGTTAGGATNSITIGSENSIYFVTQNVERGRFDSSGIGYATASFRAPIFYDSNNTAYYVDGASNSHFNTISTAGNVTMNGDLYVNWDSTSSNIFMADTDEGYRQIHCNSNRIGFLNSSGGWGSYCSDNGDWTTDYISYAGQSMRAPIFYDSNNTGYYVDPASTSNLNAISFNGGTLSGTLTMNTQNALVANNYGRGVFGLYSSTRYQHLWSMGTAYKLPDDGTTTGNLYGVAWSYPSAGGAAANLSDHGMLIINNGLYRAAISNSIRCVTDMRTPIFYDSNNTGYYLDPASTSNLNTVTAAQFNGPLNGNASTVTNGMYVNASQVITGANYFNANRNTTSNSPPLQAYGTNSGAIMAFHRGGYYAVNFGLDSDNVMRIGGWSAPQNLWQLDMSGHNTVSGSSRAPIFYDSTNTAYYTRPASSSYINSLETAGSIQAGTSGTGNIYVGGTSSNYFRFHVNSAVGAATFFDMNSGNINWRQGSSTRYIFYSTTANMTIYGTLTQGSDIRIKENIVEISDCIDKVKSIRGVYYNRTDFNTEPTKIGVIAQEVEKQMPELVHDEPTTGIKSVSYTELTAILVNAIKEQQVIIDDLKLRIEKLEL